MAGDDSTPAPPSAPKPSVPAPAKPKGITANAVKGLNSEGFSAEDLALETSGPISNRAGVTKDLGKQVDARNAVSRKLRAADEKQQTRPFTTGRKISR